MNKKIRQTVAMVWILGGMGITTALADKDEALPPVRHEPTKKACGECHMVFPPQMLPRASWDKIMSGLDSHFGENAAIADGERQEITTYLRAHAADSDSRMGRHFLRGMKGHDAPLRITETPYWLREHNKEVPPEAFRKPEVKSAANCPACHKQAEQGIYED